MYLLLNNNITGQYRPVILLQDLLITDLSQTTSQYTNYALDCDGSYPLILLINIEIIIAYTRYGDIKEKAPPNDVSHHSLT